MDELDKVDPARRAALGKLVSGAAFAVPVVASFAMAGLTPTNAYAANSNVATVPTMSEWGMIAVGVGLGAAALVAVNKARKEA